SRATRASLLASRHIGGHLRLDRYWKPFPEDAPIEWLTAKEAARFDEVFDRAVDRCLHNGPIGIFLSGGFDSISVAAADRGISSNEYFVGRVTVPGLPEGRCYAKSPDITTAYARSVPASAFDNEFSWRGFLAYRGMHSAEL